MKPEDAKTFEELKNVMVAHDKSDAVVHGEIRAFMARMEPVIKLFEENNIYKMKFKEETGTLVFYGKALLTAGSILAGIWWLINHLR